MRPCAATEPEMPGDELLLLWGPLLLHARVDGEAGCSTVGPRLGRSVSQLVTSQGLGHIRGRSPNITGPCAHW